MVSATRRRPGSCPLLTNIDEGDFIDEPVDGGDPSSDHDKSETLEGNLDCPTCRRRLISEGSTIESVVSRGRYQSTSAMPLMTSNPWDHIWPYVALPSENEDDGTLGAVRKDVSVRYCSNLSRYRHTYLYLGAVSLSSSFPFHRFLFSQKA